MDKMLKLYKNSSLTTPYQLLPSLLNNPIYLFRYIHYLFVYTPEFSFNAQIPTQKTNAPPT